MFDVVILNLARRWNKLNSLWKIDRENFPLVSSRTPDTFTIHLLPFPMKHHILVQIQTNTRNYSVCYLTCLSTPAVYWVVSSCKASASCWDCKARIISFSLSSPSRKSSRQCSVKPILWSVPRPCGEKNSK